MENSQERTNQQRIPKVIHYCWFGGNPKPELVLRCMDSWRTFCPDWEIKEWNETNFDVNQHPFMQAAYDAKKWAFVSDLARLIIVYEHGGVYMDTDVELKASLDSQICFAAFFAFENLFSVNSGLGFGAVPKNGCVEHMIRQYDNLTFDIQRIIACPQLNTKALQMCFPDLKLNGEQTQRFGDTVIYSIQDFTEIGRHHGMQSWVEGPKWNPDQRKRTKLSFAIQSWLKKPEKFIFIEKYFGPKAKKIYSFLAYDLFDCGIGFYLRRLWYRINKK